jgi:hypothetical protein
MHDYLPKDDAKHVLPFILAIAFLLFAFGAIAQNVETGASFAFDHAVVLAFRDAANPSVPIGPSWLQEAARDLTSLGSIIVLLIVTFAVFRISVFGSQERRCLGGALSRARRHRAQRIAQAHV